MKDKKEKGASKPKKSKFPQMQVIRMSRLNGKEIKARVKGVYNRIFGKLNGIIILAQIQK